MNEFFDRIKMGLESLIDGVNCKGQDYMSIKQIRDLIKPNKKVLLKNVSKKLDENLYLMGFKDYFIYDVS